MAFNPRDISADLHEIKRKEFLEQKRRQRLRENSEELREIERQLRSAYFVSQLKAQQDEVESRKKEERIIKEQEAIKIEEQLKRNEELQKQQEIQKQQQKDNFRSTLKEQMSESLHRRQKQLEEMARDRDHVDRMIERLKIEQETEKKELEERKQSMKQELEDFMRLQEERKSKERALDETNRKIAEEVQRQRDLDKKRLEDLKRAERVQQEALSETIGLNVHKTELEKRRRENIMLDLLEEERKAKEDYRFRQNLERQVRARDHVRQELERYIEQRKLERESQRRNKLNVESEEMKRIIKENETITAQEVKNMRDKMEAYNNAIQEMLEERRKQRSSNMTEHMRDFKILQNEERKIQQEIDDERIRLLGNHSKEILNQLPAGVLRESDREFFALPPPRYNK